MKIVRSVLVYFIKNDEILLLLRNKKSNDLNEGKWIGIGGKIENGESDIDALFRESKEEVGLKPLNYQKLGIVHFYDDGYYEEMTLFRCTNFDGQVKDCNEGTLKYIDIKDIFSLNLWEGDKIFLPFVFNNQTFKKIVLKYKHHSLVESNIEK